MKNTHWNQILSGQIVTFRYKSEGDRSVNRTVLCLDPEYLYRKKGTRRIVRLFIGLELKAADKKPLPLARVRELFSLLGDVDDTPEQTSELEMRKIYTKLKFFLEKNPIFRTYLLRKCRKYRVFLEDSYGTIPITSIKRMERLEKRIRETGKKMAEEGLKEVKRSFKDRTLRNLDED
tara:strand:+ start:594 stop:1124 length:531 start_codon:yes stop_codon:yes gene_type:complete